MNSASNVMNQSPAAAEVMAPAVVSWGRQMYWCARRELWESRSIYIAPLAAGALALVACLVSVARLPERMRAAGAVDLAQQLEMVEGPYDMAGLLIMGATFLVALFYSLDALYGERRDRSILFWKSLPVSDTTTVLAKASIPMLVLPALTFLVSMVVQTIVLLATRAALAGSGVDAQAAWGHFSFWHASWMLLYHLIALHGLGYSPFYAWLLLVGAWARRLPILWATLPPIAIGVFEKVAFNTSYFAELLMGQLGGRSHHATRVASSMSMDSLSSPPPGEFLINPGLWLSLVVAAVFLALAIRLRRQRGPI
jgi:ABC-2 type transport system permease protein